MIGRSLRPLPAGEFDDRKARHLLNRAGFGGTPSQVRALADMGLRRAVDYLVDFEKIDAPPVRVDQFDKDIMRPLAPDQRQAVRLARRTHDEATLERFRQMRQSAQRADRTQIRDIQRWWLARMIETPRPLQEKMTIFWHGHFATGYRAIEDSYHMFMQNQLFRYHAVGSFRALAHAIIRDPAMIAYLNNNQNRKEAPNENLARELMELFTLGEGNDYTESDIKHGARALTGYTYRDDEFINFQSPQYQRLHDHSLKRILGKTGNWDGDDFVQIILTRHVAGRFICWKLYRYFVNDLPGVPQKPAQRFISDLAKVLRDRNYHLKPVLKALFKSAHFYDSANVASQIKSPIQLIVGAIRSLQVPPRNLSVLLSAAELMGQNIFYPPSVKGWEGGRAWLNTSTLFVRQNLMIYLLTGRRPDTHAWQNDGPTYDPMHLIEHLRSPQGMVKLRDAVTHLLGVNLASPPHPSRLDVLVRFAESGGGTLDKAMLVALLSLITATPEYQLC